MAAIAWAYDGKSQTAKAIEYFEKSVATEPANIGRWISLGQIYMRSNIKQYSRALECFNNASKNKPTAEQIVAINKLIIDCKQRMAH